MRAIKIFCGFLSNPATKHEAYAMQLARSAHRKGRKVKDWIHLSDRPTSALVGNIHKIAKSGAEI